MRALACGLLLLVIPVLVAASQTPDPPEFGQFSELAWKRKIFVMSRDLEARNAIVGQIEEYVKKKKITAQIVDRIEDAEIVVSYGDAGYRAYGANLTQFGELAVAIRGSEIPGSAGAPVGKTYRPRIVYSTKSSRSYSGAITFQKSAHKKAIRKFLDGWAKLQKVEMKNIATPLSTNK